jgi:Uncharacterized conserved protein (DUF2267)/BON domain
MIDKKLRTLIIGTTTGVLTITTIRQVVDRPEGPDLADRVRTSLGPLLHALDLPRVHVMAEGSVVLLHGDVSSVTDAECIEDRVARIPGVSTVESHLHVGLLPGDSRPSAGHDGAPQSAMLIALLATAEAIGITGSPARAAVRGTLNAVLSQIPPGERVQLVEHFPNDVRALVNARRVIGETERHWRTELALDVAAAWRGGITVDDAQVLVPAVIGVVRRFVPEEDADVEATLKRRIKDLWDMSVDPNHDDVHVPTH